MCLYLILSCILLIDDIIGDVNYVLMYVSNSIIMLYDYVTHGCYPYMILWDIDYQT